MKYMYTKICLPVYHHYRQRAFNRLFDRWYQLWYRWVFIRWGREGWQNAAGCLNQQTLLTTLKNVLRKRTGVDFSYGTLLKIYIYKLNGLSDVYVNNICHKCRARVNNSISQ